MAKNSNLSFAGRFPRRVALFCPHQLSLGLKRCNNWKAGENECVHLVEFIMTVQNGLVVQNMYILMEGTCNK